MPQSVRHALASLLIALHAVIAVGGAGLHAGPVLGHAGAARHESSGDPAQLAANPADHCPICDHCVQGQLPLEPVILALSPGDAPLELVAGRVQAPRPPPSCSRSRAPPSAIGSIEPTSLEAYSGPSC